MTRALTPIVLGIAALLLPAAATAKEITKVSVCGAGGECKTFDRSDREALSAFGPDGGPAGPPSKPAAWYRVTFTHDGRADGGSLERWTIAYVPSAGKYRVRALAGRGYEWVRVNPDTQKVLEGAVRTLPALPAGRMRLDATTPKAQVHEVFQPAATVQEPGSARSVADAGSSAIGWILAALAAAALALGSGVALRRRRLPGV